MQWRVPSPATFWSNSLAMRTLRSSAWQQSPRKCTRTRDRKSSRLWSTVGLDLHGLTPGSFFGHRCSYSSHPQSVQAVSISSGVLRLSRRSETAARLALGAPPRQPFVQMAAESAVVGGVAAFAGLRIAHPVIPSIVRWPPADPLRLSDTALHLSSFSFARGVAAFVSVVCSPARGWAVSRVRLDSAFRETDLRSSDSHRQTQREAIKGLRSA